MPPAVWWNLAVITWIGPRFIKRLAMRVADQPLLCRRLLVSYGLRVALALAIFAISYWQLPILHARNKTSS